MVNDIIGRCPLSCLRSSQSLTSMIRGAVPDLCRRPRPPPPTSSPRSTPSSAQVAEALRGPVRVLAGAGTGKTRAITHRIAYGVATGVYAPTEVLAVTFTTRAAGEMRTRLRQLGAAGVQARTFHSAALRQLRYFWPRRSTAASCPTLTESKIGMVAGAARRLRVDVRPGAAARPGLRDRVGQGLQRRPRRLRRASRPAGAGRSAARPRDGRPGVREATSRSSATRAGWTWRTSCC